MDVTRRGMGLLLRGLRRLAGVDLLDRYHLRQPVQDLVRRVSRDGMRSAGATARAFGAAQRRLSGPARQEPVEDTGLFDLTPTDEQQMLVDALERFADQQLRPAAREADDACATPPGILEQAQQLGVGQLGIPTELGGFVEHRASTTGVLAAQALAEGDMGLAVACLAPAGAATALALWGDAEQQSRFLTAFTDEDPPPAAVALLEPQAAFDPFAPDTTAKRREGELVLQGTKSLVPRVAEAELFVVGAELAGRGPVLVLVESDRDGLTVEPEPAMGLRAAATGRLVLDDVRVPQAAVLGDGPQAHAEAVRRARLGWCALTLGTCRAVLDYVVPYVNQREAFGEPISHRQAVAFMVADTGVELEGMRLATLRAAARADRDLSISRQVGLARRLCADHGVEVGSDGVQLLGGHGYVKEHPVERWYRDLRAAGVMEGGVLL